MEGTVARHKNLIVLFIDCKGLRSLADPFTERLFPGGFFFCATGVVWFWYLYVR